MHPHTFLPLAALGIPLSNNTVDVKVINSFNTTPGHVPLPSALLFSPAIPGHELVEGDFYSFLIENGRTGERVMFDLGLRKDTPNLAPAAARMYQGLVVEDDVPSQLVRNGVGLESISAVIWR